MTVGFVGLSHLGIISSVAAASKGHDVVAYDPDPTRCADLEAGRLPIVEEGLPELLASNRSRLRFTHDPTALKACELIICSSDVPTTSEHRSDVSIITRLIETVVTVASPGTTLVILSQVPPGFTRAVKKRNQQENADRQLQVFYQVETLIIGRSVERALQPERCIVGCREPERELPESYANLLKGFGCPILKMRYESAELAKISINLFLISSVCTTNTLAELCEAIGAEWSEIVPALRLDRRIGERAYLTPGLGLSGGNLERDLMTASTLAEEHGTDTKIIAAWLANSSYRRDWVLRHLRASVLTSTDDPVIAMWGLAYKPHTASVKNSPALALVAALRSCSVQAYDPEASWYPEGVAHVTRMASALKACEGADALIIMTPWPEFASVNLVQVRELMRGRCLVDPFGLLDRDRCITLGFRYRKLGAPIGEGMAIRREEQAVSPWTR